MPNQSFAFFNTSRIAAHGNRKNRICVDSVMVVAPGPHLTTMPQAKNGKPTNPNPSDAIQKRLRFVKTAIEPMANRGLCPRASF